MSDHVSELIRVLAQNDTAQLREKWATLYGIPPKPRISRELLIRGVAYRIQEDAYGGISKLARNQLERLARDLSHGESIPSSSSQIAKSGTRLLREWKGKVHEVTVTDEGYQWRGTSYRSLSEIARAITGTRWSGPRFFGVEVKTSPAKRFNGAGPTHRRARETQGGC